MQEVRHLYLEIKIARKLRRTKSDLEISYWEMIQAKYSDDLTGSLSVVGWLKLILEPCHPLLLLD